MLAGSDETLHSPSCFKNFTITYIGNLWHFHSVESDDTLFVLQGLSDRGEIA